jgi:hypothetical protein
LRAVAFIASLAVGAPLAAAGPASEVASAFDAGDELDLHMWLDYDVEWRRAAIHRERAGLPGTEPGDPLPVVRDLIFEGSRQLVTPRLELGFFTDVALTLALPVVLRDRRRLELDGRGVDRGNSTTIVDGLLPAEGFDAGDPDGAGFPSGAVLFRGVDRRGLDQVHTGLVWAPMNQARDRTKPTWKLGLEARIAVGKVARLDPADPAAADGVGRGVHELRAWTSMARRFRRVESHIEMWWLGAVGEKASSPFAGPERPFGARNTRPMQRAGGRFGAEAFVVDRPADGFRLALTGAATLEARFDGRDYSEMWEVFALAGAATGDGPLVLDGDPLTPGQQAQSHPGISNIENYLELTGEAGIEAQLGSRVRLAARFRYADQQGHLVSYADAGVDKPTCAAGQTSGCEPMNNDVVDPGTEEVNPLHVPLIDSVGHRYRVEGGRTIGIGVELRVLF